MGLHEVEAESVDALWGAVVVAAIAMGDAAIAQLMFVWTLGSIHWLSMFYPIGASQSEQLEPVRRRARCFLNEVMDKVTFHKLIHPAIACS